MKKIMLLAVLLIAPACFAQNQQVNAALTAQDSGSCASANACLVLRLNANSGATIVQTSGTFSATYQFEGTADGANWVAVNGNPVGSTTAVQSATSPGAWQVNVAGMVAVRVRVSTYASGTVQAVITSSVASAAARGGSGGGGSGTVNPGLAHQPAFYPSSGTAVSGTCTVPVTNGQFPMMFNVTADAAVDPSCPQQGFVNTAITGAATSYAITSANNLQGIEHDVAGSQSVTYTLPTPTTLENPQFAIPQICNYSTHTDTLTPTTWTVNGAASVTIPSNTCRSLSVDPFNANNWLAPSGGAPSGPAGGCLSGTYPNPTGGQCITPNQNAFYISTNCGTQTNCLTLNDNNSTDNCGTPLTNFIAAFNAYSGPGWPVLDFEDNGANGGAFKFSSCNIIVLVSSTVIVNATLNAASSQDNLFQVGPSGRSSYGSNFIYVTFRGTGTIIGGASLTTAGIHTEPYEGTIEISGIHFLSFGAANATLGNCTNYAMYFDTDSEEDVHDTWWYQIANPNDTTVGRCILYDVDNSPSGGGQNTARIYGNHWATYHGGGAQGCGSQAIVEGGTHTTIQNNSIAGFAIPIRLQSKSASGNGGFIVNGNALDEQGCTAKGVSAEIHLGGNAQSGLLQDVAITDNDTVGASASYLLALAGDTTQTISGFTVANNVADNTGTQTVAPTTLACADATVVTVCRQDSNINMNIGGNNSYWFGPNQTLASLNRTSQGANLSATTIFTPNAALGVFVNCYVVLITSGAGSTVPSCVITFTDGGGSGGAATTLPLTSTTVTSTVGQATSGSARVVAKGSSNIQISTTGWVSGTYSVYASIEMFQ